MFKKRPTKEEYINMVNPEALRPENMKELCDLLGPNIYEQMYGKNSAFQVRKELFEQIAELHT
ncbi:MAG: hypothetical protein PHN69_05760 [Candidatus Pacebacteria bacterium]|nr:hypothetical protein [Candidatus Paceibacterota bacterium]